MLKKCLTPHMLEAAFNDLKPIIDEFIQCQKVKNNIYSPCDKLINLEMFISELIEIYYIDQQKLSEQEQKIDNNKKRIHQLCNKINGKTDVKGRCNKEAFADYIASIYSLERSDISKDFSAPIIGQDISCDMHWYKWLVTDLCSKKRSVKKQINFLTHDCIYVLGISNYLAELFDQLLDNPGCITDVWARKLVYPSYKKGDKKDPVNYRPLSDNLLFFAKILHNILAEQLNRLVTVKKKLNKSVQKGINIGSSGVFDANMLFLKYLCKDKSGSLRVPLFFDIKNAYGSVNHQMLFDVLLGHLIDHRVLSYIKRYYELATAKIGERVIPWNIGLFQGDPLSNILYVIFKNAIIHEFCSVFNRDDCMIAFIDDIVLLPKDIHEAKIMLFTFRKILQKYKLKCNMEKSGFLYINDFNGNSAITIDKLSIGSFTIERFENNIVRYLGSFIGHNVDSMFEHFVNTQVNKLEIIDDLKCTNEIKLHVYYKTVYSRITWDLQKFLIIFDKAKLSAIFKLEKFFIQKWSYDMSSESIDAFIESRYKYIVMKSYQKVMGSTDINVTSLSNKYDSSVQNINKAMLNIAPPIDMLVLDGYDFNTELTSDVFDSDGVEDLLGMDLSPKVIEINISEDKGKEQDEDQDDPFECLQNKVDLLSINPFECLQNKVDLLSINFSNNTDNSKSVHIESVEELAHRLAALNNTEEDLSDKDIILI